MQVEFSLRRLRRTLAVTTALIAALGLAAELCDHLWAPAWAATTVPLLSLSYEVNLPTWYVVCLHAACALGCALAATHARADGAPHGTRWGVLAGLFAYVSADELIQIHEAASGWFDTGGLLYFGWIIPAAVVVVALGLWFVPFLRALPPATRRRFVTAGGIFVGGALLMELPLGWWTERAGADNLVYALIDWVEETLELAGVTLFLCALVSHLAGARPGPDGLDPSAPDRVTLTLGPATPPG